MPTPSTGWNDPPIRGSFGEEIWDRPGGNAPISFSRSSLSPARSRLCLHFPSRCPSALAASQCANSRGARTAPAPGSESKGHCILLFLGTRRAPLPLQPHPPGEAPIFTAHRTVSTVENRPSAILLLESLRHLFTGALEMSGTRHVQATLDFMANTDRVNINSLEHIKSFLSAVFWLADQQAYYEAANPARETSLPQVRPAEETHAYSLEEVLTMIDAVREPASYAHRSQGRYWRAER